MTRTTTAFAGLLLVPVLLGVGAGCDEKKTSAAPAVSSLAPSPPPPPGAKTTKFTIDPASKTSMELDAPKEKIKAATTGAAGSLDVDLTNIQSSRGEIKIDLSTLTTSSFKDTKDNEAQTTHARTWLEVADGQDGKLDEAVKAANRYAVYAIRGIENPSATDVTKLPPSKEDGDDVRTVSLRSNGELLIHGHPVNREAELEVKFHYPAGADAMKPMWIGIKTKSPLRVVLAEHDVKPRDGFGKIAKGSFNLLGTKVADNADITLDLRANRQP